MVLDLLSFVKDLARDIYAARHYLKENRETCSKIYDKLRELQNLIARTKPVSDDSELKRILSSIEDELLSVREEFEKIKMRRSRKVRKFLTGAYEARKLDSMLSTCITCQQRLEVLCTMARNNQEFSSLVSNVKQCETIMSRTMHGLADASAEFSKSVGIVHDAVESIPLLVSKGRSSDVLPLSSAAADHSGQLLESSIDANERKSIESFSQLPSAVCVLMSELARKRLLPENVTKHLERIGKMWKGWRVDINDVEYDEMPNGKPYKIGKGADSVVYAAKYKTACQGSGKLSIPIAVKEIDVDDLSSGGGKGNLLREFFLQLSLHSPYIIQTFGICWPGEVSLEPDTADEAQYEDVISGKDRTVRIVMERMACNLRHALRTKILKASEDKIRVLRDICKALSYLHERNIVHRDVKPENILLSMDKNGIVGVAKLADFGCSRLSHDRRLAKTMSTASSARGTTTYTPPEVIENPEKCCTRKSWDIWSYGRVICDVLSPTKDVKLSTFGVMNHWKKGILIERLQQAATSIEDQTFKALATKCLSTNEKDRPQISVIEKVIDECNLESVGNCEVDEVIPLGEVGEGCERGLERTNLGSGNQSPTQHKLPTGEVKDTAHHKGKDGHRGFHAYTPEDSGQLAQISGHVSEKAQSAKESERKAVQLLKESAGKGSTYAKYQLGVCYENGTGVERDVSMAVKLYKEAAEGGSTSAKNNLGFCYLNGTGVERDVPMAVRLYKEAAHGGNTDAKVRLGVCYKNGIGVKRDVSKAVELYKEAAHGGNMFAIFNLGACHQNGAGVERDVSKAVHLYKKAAHGGNIRAKNKLALCYGSGTGVKRDLSKAVQLYKEAAEGGSRSAKSNLGFCFATGIGVEQDVLKAVQLYKEAAEGGNMDAKIRLAECYEHGTGVERDVSLAVQLYKKAAHGGSTDAKVRLGVCYEHGTGVKRDVLKAVKLYKIAADRGNMFGKYNLGVCYENGTGVERNVSMAVKLYKEAADGGNIRAKNNLGACFENGTGVERDVSKAMQLYKEAVEGGSTIAKRNLEACHGKGYGVVRNVSMAVPMYKEAVEGGITIAKKNSGVCYEEGIEVERMSRKLCNCTKKLPAKGV